MTVLPKPSTSYYILKGASRDPRNHTGEHGFGSRNGSRRSHARCGVRHTQFACVAGGAGSEGTPCCVHDRPGATAPISVAAEVGPSRSRAVLPAWPWLGRDVVRNGRTSMPNRPDGSGRARAELPELDE